jgi:phosphoenolpyruvate phosphomutase
MSKASKLRELFNKEGVIQIVGAHDGLTAKLVELNGFDGVWASGLELSASHAVPDSNILTMSQFLESATIMNDAVSCPVVADCDTGFGNSNNVMHMVRKYEAAGIAAVTIEDKMFPKVNSYIPGRQELAPIAEFVGKILAAKSTQQTEDFMVIARVEALVAGWSQEEALRRAHAYAEAGADAIFIHSKSNTPDEIITFAGAWDSYVPLVICPTSYPVITLDEIKRLGIKMVIYANQGLRASIKAINEVLQEIKARGKLDVIEDKIVPMSNVFELQGMTQMKQQEELYLKTGEESVTVIIPAAGAPNNQESLEPLLQEVPLAMLDINGKSLLQRNVETLNKQRIYDICVVTGYKSVCFDVEGVKYYHNKDYDKYHILKSIMTAEDKMEGRILIVFSDILFDSSLIDRIINVSTDITLVVDSSFNKTQLRNKKLDLVCTKYHPEVGIRTLTFDRSNPILRIGKNIPEDEADYEFIGMAMFSSKGTEILREEYNNLKKRHVKRPFGESESLQKASFVDIIQHLIDKGIAVSALEVNSGWMEIHTFENYKKACATTAIV